MSDVLCFHQCDCDCHRQVTKKHAAGSDALFEMPEIMHVMPCCQGRCLHPGCGKFIKTDMMKPHLMDCHRLTEADADNVIATPYNANMIIADILRNS